jgi:hypothetical protein
MIDDHGQLRVNAVEGQDDDEADAECDGAQGKINAAERALETLYTF